MQILVVEDDPHVLDGLGAALRGRGYSVALATTVREALAAAASAPPDILVSDWQLQDDDGDGVDIAASVSSDFDSAVIMVTARDVDELRSRAADIRVSAFLRKPIRLQALFDVIEAIQS